MTQVYPVQVLRPAQVCSDQTPMVWSYENPAQELRPPQVRVDFDVAGRRVTERGEVLERDRHRGVARSHHAHAVRVAARIEQPGIERFASVDVRARVEGHGGVHVHARIGVGACIGVCRSVGVAASIGVGARVLRATRVGVLTSVDRRARVTPRIDRRLVVAGAAGAREEEQTTEGGGQERRARRRRRGAGDEVVEGHGGRARIADHAAKRALRRRAGAPRRCGRAP